MRYKNVCLSCGHNFKQPKINRYTTMVSLEFGGIENIGCVDWVCPECESVNVILDTTDRYFQCMKCGCVDSYDHYTDDGEHEVRCPECKNKNVEEI